MYRYKNIFIVSPLAILLTQIVEAILTINCMLCFCAWCVRFVCVRAARGRRAGGRFFFVFLQALRRLETEENGRKERGETCNLCGYSAKTFEPMTYYCNGAQCNGKRIGRGRYFYHASGSNQWHWCSVSVVAVCCE